MKRRVRVPLLLLLVAGALLAVILFAPQRVPGGAWLQALLSDATGAVLRRATVASRLEQYGAAARARLAPDFSRAGVGYPPDRVVLLGLKQERRLELYASSADGTLRFVRDYPVLAASGRLGPKLREGDSQVPEGLYRVESLNPNSRFHLSLRVSYPNAFDREQAKRDGRRWLGGDIMIHGKRASIGCLAMGDEAAEDLFVLAADTGVRNVEVVLSPVDFRNRALPSDLMLPAWSEALYTPLRERLVALPLGVREGRAD